MGPGARAGEWVRGDGLQGEATFSSVFRWSPPARGWRHTVLVHLLRPNIVWQLLLVGLVSSTCVVVCHQVEPFALSSRWSLWDRVPVSIATAARMLHLKTVKPPLHICCALAVPSLPAANCARQPPLAGPHVSDTQSCQEKTLNSKIFLKSSIKSFFDREGTVSYFWLHRCLDFILSFLRQFFFLILASFYVLPSYNDKLEWLW